MSPLDRKLLRDLWRIKGQAVAIGLVVAIGVLMMVMMTGLVTSLDETRRAYYERYRLAEVFAPVIRAPERLATDLAAIPGVSAVEVRVTGIALIDLEGLDLPLQAKAVSLPDFGEPRLNDIYLTDGRKLDSDRSDEVLLLKTFAEAHGLRPGDTLSATMKGSRRRFRIVGLAQSPEFLYTTAPGELVPDDARFGVLWMSRSALEAAYDMEGAFNEALLALGRGAEEAAVLDRVDRILEPYGGLGAYGLEDQASNRFLSDEIAGLRKSSTGVPPIFLAVAAFLLYLVISRMVQAEREQIGLMKAFGYTNIEVGSHYFKMVLAIAAGGAAAGCVLGVAAGAGDDRNLSAILQVSVPRLPGGAVGVRGGLRGERGDGLRERFVRAPPGLRADPPPPPCARPRRRTTAGRGGSAGRSTSCWTNRAGWSCGGSPASRGRWRAPSSGSPRGWRSRRRCSRCSRASIGRSNSPSA